MKWQELEKSKAIEIVEQFNNAPYPQGEGIYKELQHRLSEEYAKVDPYFTLKDKYAIDLKFGLRLYDILNNEFGFTLRDASNHSVWRYLSIIVVPNLVSLRWGDSFLDHTINKPTRNWLYSLWWYIHLSWQGNEESTYEILKNHSTDEIMNLVERSGKKGYQVEVYRCLMKNYNLLNLKNYKHNLRSVLRVILKLNTAYINTIEPMLFENGVEGYIDYLFGHFDFERKGEC